MRPVVLLEEIIVKHETGGLVISPQKDYRPDLHIYIYPFYCNLIICYGVKRQILVSERIKCFTLISMGKLAMRCNQIVVCIVDTPRCNTVLRQEQNFNTIKPWHNMDLVYSNWTSKQYWHKVNKQRISAWLLTFLEILCHALWCHFFWRYCAMCHGATFLEGCAPCATPLFFGPKKLCYNICTTTPLSLHCVCGTLVQTVAQVPSTGYYFWVIFWVPFLCM